MTKSGNRFSDKIMARNYSYDAPRLRLGVNVDHVATIRNARGGRHPDPVRAAKLAIAAGADGITAHLREDRRHIRDDDIARLKARDRQAAQFRNGGDRGNGGDRAEDQAACGLPGAGKAHRAHHRRRARRRGAAQSARAGGAALKHAGIRVSLFIAASRRRSRRRPRWARR